MTIGLGIATALTALLLGVTSAAEAQVQIRVGVPGRATYSELHEALRPGTPRADTVVRIQRLRNPATALAHRAHGHRRRRRLERRPRRPHPPGRAQERRLCRQRTPVPRARSRARRTTRSPRTPASARRRHAVAAGDRPRAAPRGRGRFRRPGRHPGPAAVEEYDHGDAWVLGRLGAGAKDSLSARFLSADSAEFKVRYLTLLSYFTDPTLIPLLARVYAAPDSFGCPSATPFEPRTGCSGSAPGEHAGVARRSRGRAGARRV